VTSHGGARTAVNSASSASPADDASPRVSAAQSVARRSRRAALAIAVAVGWLGLGLVAVVSLGGLVLQGFARAVTLVPRAIVWLFLAAQDGADWWSIAGRASAAVVATLSSSQVLWWLIGLELLGVAALLGLHAMLRGEMRGRDSEEVDQ
jgi:hypothetical protein